jgi:hypothetical protein
LIKLGLLGGIMNRSVRLVRGGVEFFVPKITTPGSTQSGTRTSFFGYFTAI